MQRLSSHKEVIYDTQCVIYKCFKITVKGKQGEFVVKDELFTDKTQTLTSFLLSKRIVIKIIKEALDEINNRVITEVVKKKINEGKTRKDYGLEEMIKFPEDAELEIVRRFREKLAKFSKDLYITVGFKPKPENIGALKKFYKEEIQNTPALKAKYDKNKGVSYIDENLIVFSKESIAPLITNDSGIYNFKDELEQRGICFKIYPLAQLN